jgi:predicted MFS family arabinose efflux permease
VACIFTIGAGYIADKHKQRGIYMLIFELSAIIGFVLLASSGKPGIQYTGTFFAASGIYPLVPMGVAWNGNNIGGSLKRGVGIAMHVGFGNLGGAISAFLFLPQYSPRFVASFPSKDWTSTRKDTDNEIGSSQAMLPLLPW